MNSIFVKEEEVIKNSVLILESNIIENEKDKELYSDLVKEYKELLEQMKRMVKVSDIIENKLNCVRLSIEEISKIDFLTNIYNRRYFNEAIIDEWKNCKKNREYLSVIMIDVDKFKAYNDTYGHIKGDKCLQSISAVIKDTIQESKNIVSRYGGEEFIVLIPNKDLDKAKYIAENIRENIEKLGILHEGSKEYRIVTVSIGIAANIPNGKLSPEKLINMADEALYRAKSSGRNKVSI